MAPAIDQRLRVLDAHPQLERLRLDGQSLRGERAPGVARAVTGREQQRVAGDLSARGLERHHARGDAAREPQRVDARAPVEANARGGELGAQPRQDPMQPVGADVCARVVEHVFGGAAAHQHFEDGQLERVLDARVELAVGVGPGAAFAEQEVALGIRHAGALERREIPPALAQLGAPVAELDGDPVARERQRGEEPRRACAQHRDPAAGQRGMDRGELEPADLGRAHHPAAPLGALEPGRAEAGVDGEVDVDHEAQPARAVAAPRIHRLPRDAHAAQHVGAEARGGQRSLAQHALGLVEGELDAEHPPGVQRHRAF